MSLGGLDFRQLFCSQQRYLFWVLDQFCISLVFRTISCLDLISFESSLQVSNVALAFLDTLAELMSQAWFGSCTCAGDVSQDVQLLGRGRMAITSCLLICSPMIHYSEPYGFM